MVFRILFVQEMDELKSLLKLGEERMGFLKELQGLTQPLKCFLNPFELSRKLGERFFRAVPKDLYLRHMS